MHVDDWVVLKGDLAAAGGALNRRPPSYQVARCWSHGVGGVADVCFGPGTTTCTRCRSVLVVALLALSEARTGAGLQD
jgi:hypothetical protein